MQPNQSLKQIKDFPDLMGADLFRNLSVQHFKNGLDTNLVLVSDEYGARLSYPIPKSGIVIEKNHILFVLLQRSISYNCTPEDAKEIVSFFKKEIASLHHQGLLDKAIGQTIALLLVCSRKDTSLIEHLIEVGIVSSNETFKDGRSLLMFAQEKSKIDTLIRLGADANQKVTLDPKSHLFGKDVYDIAIERSVKSWLLHLKPHVPLATIEKYDNKRLIDFKETTDLKHQNTKFITSLKEENELIINEILSNQEKYKSLIQSESGMGKNLLHQAISHAPPEILEKVLRLDFYKNNKSYINKDKECYTTMAINAQRSSTAQALYKAGFVDKPTLINSLECQWSANAGVCNLLIEDGYDASVSLRWSLAALNKLEEKLEHFSLLDIEGFFKSSPYTLKLSNLIISDKDVVYKKDNTHKKIAGSHIKFICKILKREKALCEKSNSPSFERHWISFLTHLGQNKDKVSRYFALCTLSEFPESKIQVLDLVGGDKPWAVKLIKEDLTSLLLEVKEKDEPLQKKFKI